MLKKIGITFAGLDFCKLSELSLFNMTPNKLQNSCKVGDKTNVVRGSRGSMVGPPPFIIFFFKIIFVP